MALQHLPTKKPYLPAKESAFERFQHNKVFSVLWIASHELYWTIPLNQVRSYPHPSPAPQGGALLRSGVLNERLGVDRRCAPCPPSSPPPASTTSGTWCASSCPERTVCCSVAWTLRSGTWCGFPSQVSSPPHSVVSAAAHCASHPGVMGQPSAHGYPLSTGGCPVCMAPDVWERGWDTEFRVALVEATPVVKRVCSAKHG